MKSPHLSIQPITTRIFRRGESLATFVCEHIDQSSIDEPLIIAVTSKIVSLAENRLVSKTAISKQDLIAAEADHNFGEVGHGCFLTIKHGLFIPSAGIDESNSESGDYILYPEDPFRSARELGMSLRTLWGIEKLGVVFTDSHTTPLRRGVTGISLGTWGFRGVTNLIGSPDLFGRRIEMTTVNVADGLAAAATLMMGEANECRPLALIKGGEVTFTEDIDFNEVAIPLLDDLYYPFFAGLLSTGRSSTACNGTGTADAAKG